MASTDDTVEPVTAADTTVTPENPDTLDAPDAVDTATPQGVPDADTRADQPPPIDAVESDEGATPDEVDNPATLDEPGEPEEVAPSAAVPSFGLLFQAPEPVTAPRRRASRPAMEPARPAPDSDEDDQGSSVSDTTAEEDDGRSGDRSGSAEASESGDDASPRRRSRGGRGRGRRTDDAESSSENERDPQGRQRGGRADDGDSDADGSDGSGPDTEEQHEQSANGSSKRRRRRRRSGSGGDGDDPPGTVTKVREPRKQSSEVQGVKGSTRLEAKKQRRREGREAGRRRTVITEAEFLARRESVERVMVVRTKDDRTQIGVLEDGVLVEHYVSRQSNASMAGNVYLGRIQNVLPSMEAAFVDIGKGRNAVLYAGEVNWDAAGLEQGKAKRIENALTSGESVLVQVTKDPIGHKGARLTSQISLPGRFLVYVPEGNMTGISRKLPDTERARLKAILKEVVPSGAGVIVRTAAEGASETELRADVERLTKAWEKIQAAIAKKDKKKTSGAAPALVYGEPDLTVRVIRDIFNEDFAQLVVAGDRVWDEISDYVGDVAPDLVGRLQKWTSEEDVFRHYRVDEQLAKAMEGKVWLPSGGSLVIDRTEAMTVIDVNTGKFVGQGGNLEETVTKNNIEAAEEIVRQLRLRDIGGIIVIDFIDMVLESNRDLVVRRLLECLGRDRTKHQVAEVTSLGLVQMTRKRVGAGLIEVFSEPCEHCHGRGLIVHGDPVDTPVDVGAQGGGGRKSAKNGKGRAKSKKGQDETDAQPVRTGPTAAEIAAKAHAAAIKTIAGESSEDDVAELPQERAGGAAETAMPAQPVEPIEPVQPAQAVEPAEQVVSVEPPRRRKRARVVAPAGPPKGT